MRATTILLGITFLLGVVSPAGAVILTIDPDDYPLVTDPTDTNAAPMDTSALGVQLSTRMGIDTKVFAVTSLVSPNTNMVFGHSAYAGFPAFGKSWGGQYAPSYGDRKEYFEARFDTPTDWVSLDFIPNGTGDKNGYLFAYTSNGMPIGAVYTGDSPLPVGVPITLEISANSTGKIGYVFASWDFHDICGSNGELDNLKFEGEIIPEPSSIVIWSLIGLTCGMLCYRRKRRTAA